MNRRLDAVFVVLINHEKFGDETRFSLDRQLDDRRKLQYKIQTNYQTLQNLKICTQTDCPTDCDEARFERRHEEIKQSCHLKGVSLRRAFSWRCPRAIGALVAQQSSQGHTPLVQLAIGIKRYFILDQPFVSDFLATGSGSGSGGARASARAVGLAQVRVNAQEDEGKAVLDRVAIAWVGRRAAKPANAPFVPATNTVTVQQKEHEETKKHAQLGKNELSRKQKKKKSILISAQL
jgi:hypothetical protein